MNQVTVKYRFPAQYEGLVNRLYRKSKESSQGIFESYVDIMVFSASVGCSAGKRIPFEKPTNKTEPVRAQHFESSISLHVPALLALYDSDSVEIFEDSETSTNNRIQIFEEYICGGLSIIEDRLKGEPNKNVLGVLANLVKETMEADIRDSGSPDLPSAKLMEVLTGGD